MTPTFTVIRDVSESLKNLIQANISELASAKRVAYESPADLTPGGQPRLSMFLYKVRYNKYLRTEPPVRVSANLDA